MLEPSMGINLLSLERYCYRPTPESEPELRPLPFASFGFDLGVSF